MGPAPAIGLIGYFRGLNAAFTGDATLRNTGPSNDPHPADVVRGFLAAATVRQLEFSDASAWGDVIEAETQKDVNTIRLAGKNVSTEAAKRSAEIVSKAIVTHPMSSLEKHAFGQIQNWRDRDEALVANLTDPLTMAVELPTRYAGGTYAAHVVSAAVMSALRAPQAIPVIFDRMLGLLKVMHDANPSWGPLYVVHPGDVARDFVVGVRRARHAE